MNLYNPYADYLSRNQSQEPSSNIFLLQAKLRQKKQLEDDIEMLLQAERINKREAAENPYLSYKDIIAESQLKYRSYIEEKLAAERIKYIKEEEDASAYFINRMDRYARQRNQLSRQKLRNQYLAQLSEDGVLRDVQHSHYFERPNYPHKKQQIQKYPNYSEDLSQNLKKEQKLARSRQNRVKFIQQEDRKKEQSPNKSSPYAKIKANSPYSQRKTSKKTSKNRIPSYEHFMKNPVSDVSFHSGKKNKLNIPSLFKQSRTPYRSCSKRSSSKKRTNRSQLRKTIAIDRSASRVKSVEKDGLQKIENRLKVSEIVYEDSKFRNWKHEKNHLKMTFDNEEKGRRDIKDRLNNHPDVLKKYDLVVE